MMPQTVVELLKDGRIVVLTLGSIALSLVRADRDGMLVGNGGLLLWEADALKHLDINLHLNSVTDTGRWQAICSKQALEIEGL